MMETSRLMHYVFNHLTWGNQQNRRSDRATVKAHLMPGMRHIIHGMVWNVYPVQKRHMYAQMGHVLSFPILLSVSNGSGDLIWHKKMGLLWVDICEYVNHSRATSGNHIESDSPLETNSKRTRKPSQIRVQKGAKLFSWVLNPSEYRYISYYIMCYFMYHI